MALTCRMEESSTASMADIAYRADLGRPGPDQNTHGDEHFLPGSESVCHCSRNKILNIAKGG
jgi:hypothetical protein